ncbi:MAG: hypothetical protein HKN82_11145 [Akkermansiaceae bacterium]|nr:hypothetical protein [Akkermansiaceae bacterium]
MTTSNRLDLLAATSPAFAPWTGPFSRRDLSDWITAEFGDPAILDEPRPHGPLHAMVRAPARLLHVVSGNTPHAAAQSLLRGLVLGSHNTLKLPSGGLPEMEALLAALPPALAAEITVATELPADWDARFDRVVVFGDDDTIRWFRQHAPPGLPLNLHGQRLSIALILQDPEGAARLAAADVSRFDQRGCLSVHAVYLAPGCGASGIEFGALLAREMAACDRADPRGPLSPSEAGAITNTRETARFLAANRPDDCRLWESEGDTHWTVIFHRDPLLRPSCLNRLVYVHPWPPDQHAAALGPECRHLSTVALHPFSPASARDLPDLGATRFCPLGATQDPTIFWHHDGAPPLASLVTWIDLG